MARIYASRHLPLFFLEYSGDPENSPEQSQLLDLHGAVALQGRVSWLEAYGAFVDIALPDGRTASGLIHKSELSWSVVQIPETVVRTGAPPPPALHSSARISALKLGTL